MRLQIGPMANFHLIGEDDNFKSRSKDIYSCFENIRNNADLKKNDEKLSSKRKKNSVKNVEPGYKTEPGKWVKYSLEDTDIANDRQNTQAALSFLHDITKRSKADKSQPKSDLPVNMEEDERKESKISFKKPAPHIMSEHVVGKPKHKLPRSITESKSEKTRLSFDKVELDHLEENLSAVEYQADIEAKLDETFSFQNKAKTFNMETEQDLSNSFKSTKSHKGKRNIRKREK